MSSDNLAVQIPPLDAVRTGGPVLVAKEDGLLGAAPAHRIVISPVDSKYLSSLSSSDSHSAM